MKAETFGLDATVESLEGQLQFMYDRHDDPSAIQYAEDRLSDLYNNVDVGGEEGRGILGGILRGILGGRRPFRLRPLGLRRRPLFGLPGLRRRPLFGLPGRRPFGRPIRRPLRRIAAALLG